jgi:hypothetical protein
LVVLPEVARAVLNRIATRLLVWEDRDRLRIDALPTIPTRALLG